MKFFMMSWINLFKKEDHHEIEKLVEDLVSLSLSFPTLGISGRDSCKGGRVVTSQVCK
jgi:hypothetical protein